jgi:hypothetical protein
MFKVLFGTALLVLILDALLALITGYVAYSRGRSFWRWFLFGMVLPFASIFVALGVGIADELRRERARGGAPAPVPEPGEF